MVEASGSTEQYIIYIYRSIISKNIYTIIMKDMKCIYHGKVGSVQVSR